MPFCALCLFFTPCAGRLPPYFLPRTFLPDIPWVCPAILYFLLVSLALSPWLLQLDRSLADRASLGLLLLHSSADAFASVTSRINIHVFTLIVEHLDCMLVDSTAVASNSGSSGNTFPLGSVTLEVDLTPHIVYNAYIN